jgi:ABC-type transport system involved in cytochrome c biogenesis permease subunit
MKPKHSWWPAALALCFLAWALSSLFPPQEKGFHVVDFGRLPVLLNGRIQPFDSVARNSLLQIRGKQSAPVKLHFSVFDPAKRGQTMPATEWLLEVLMKPEAADTRKIFRIDHPELVALLKLPGPDENQGEDGKHFSFNQLKDSLDEIEKQARRVSGKEAAQRTPFERQTLKLYNSVLLYHQLRHSLQPEGLHDLAADLAAFQQAIAPGLAAIHARESGKEFSQQDLDRLLEHLQRYEPLSRTALPLIIPPSKPGQSRDAWQNMGAALMASAREGEVNPVARFYGAMATAFHDGNVDQFNRALTDYRAWVGTHFVDEHHKTRAEVLFNHLQPFYRALVIYLLAFLLICFYWVRNSENVRWAGELLVYVALGIHTAGLLYRMILEGRPPVTNLYSSAIFIGWGSAILGVILERIYRLGLGAAAAAFIGFATLIIAHNLALGGDTMEMMRAVLDSNFWLATHVVTVTIGYSSTFLAGFLGILLVLLGLFTRALTAEMSRVLGRLIYGIVCFATFFSFVGTILGGIWADQSWGRFWGWDPKENGALIIVLWNAIILHARWGGMVRERGLALMAIFGNIVTSFSWFGVNLLGVGLHAYGFTDSGFQWLLLFIASQVLLMGDALMPTRLWLSAPAPEAALAGRSAWWVALAFNALTACLGLLAGLGVLPSSSCFLAVGPFLVFVLALALAPATVPGPTPATITGK